MAMFKPDSSKPIVWNWIHNDLEICPHEIQGAIEYEQSCERTDLTLGFGSTAIGVLSTAVMLGLAGVTFAMVPAVALAVAGALHGYNSGIQGRRRELESEFIQDHPDILKSVESKLDEGQSSAKVASAYEAIFRLYRRGEDDAIIKVLGNPQTSDQTQQGIRPSENQDALSMVNPIESQPIAQPTTAPSLSNINGIETIAPRDIATDLGNHPQSALIFGTPGAGKGMNISNAIRTLRAKLPAVTVMMVDPKGDKKERGYWESQVDIFESRSLLKSSPRSSAEWMMRCIEKFQNIDGPKLLVWDELFATITVLKGQNIPKGEEPFPCLTDFQQFISLNLSLGPSSGTWVWGMSQSANLSDLGLTSGGLSTTRIIALISPDNVGAVEGYLATKAIAAPKGGMEYLDRLMEKSPVGRACYDGKTKKWYPVARLENHSGFDRDNADWNNLGKPSQSIAPSSQAKKIDSNLLPGEAEFLAKLYEYSEPVADELWKSDVERLEDLYQFGSEIELEPVEKSHPLEDKFVRLEAMLEGQESIGIRDISRAFTCKSDEAVQLAQMFCMSQKSRFKFSQNLKPNGTVSKSIDRV